MFPNQDSPNEASAINDRMAMVRIDTSSIRDALIRTTSSTNLGFPTRTIRITASEQSSRDNTPNPITFNDLISRPRSNPRNRTPMRYESPLESDAFRLHSPNFILDEPQQNLTLPQRLIPTSNVNSRTDDNGKGRSSKQGRPSQRKIRRWNNEHFSDLAHEISVSSRGGRGSRAADVLLKAHKDAHLYQSVYDPNDHQRSEKINRFMNDASMKDARELFFEGHGPISNTDDNNTRRRTMKKSIVTGDEMLHRIDQRLRRLVIRACHNSYAATTVVEVFEKYIISISSKESGISLTDEWWKDLLLESPTITQRKDNHRYSVQFYFHSTAPNGGFHRLLLHAVCQFHGLNVVTGMESNYVYENKISTARTLIAHGQRDSLTSNIYLLQQINESNN